MLNQSISKSLPPWMSKPYKKVPKEEILDWVTRAQNGESKFRDKIILQYKPFVVKHVLTTYKGVPFLEFVEAGLIGVNNAIDKFDEKRSDNFTVAVNLWMRSGLSAYLKTHLRDKAIKPEQCSILKKGVTEKSVENEYYDRYLKFLDGDISQETFEVSEVKFKRVEKWKSEFSEATVVSLDDSDSFEFDRLDAIAPKAYQEDSDDDKMRMELLEEIQYLTTKSEFDVLVSYFGLTGEPSLLLTQIAESRGVSQERVRQIKDSGLEKLRARKRDLKYAREYWI